MVHIIIISEKLQKKTKKNTHMRHDTIQTYSTTDSMDHLKKR